VAAAGVEQEVIVGEAGDHAIVEQHAELVAQQVVARARDRNRAGAAERDQVEEAAGLRPFQLDLAERGTVHDAHVATHGQRLAPGRRFHALAGKG
jgi:hypothetical protein